MIRLNDFIRIPFLPECITAVTIEKNFKEPYVELTKVNTIHSQELNGNMVVHTSIREYSIKYSYSNQLGFYTQRNDDYVGTHRTTGTVDHDIVEFGMPKFAIPYHSTLIDTPNMVIRDDESSRVLYSRYSVLVEDSRMQIINGLHFPVFCMDEIITVHKEDGKLITYSKDLSRIESEELIPGVNIEYFYGAPILHSDPTGKNDLTNLIDYIKIPIKKAPDGVMQYDVYKFDYSFENEQEE